MGSNNKNKAIMVVVGTVVAVITSSLVTRFLKGRFDPTSDLALNKVASELNRSLPMMMDAETELYSVIGMNKSIIYNYRLVNMAKENVPVAAIAGLKPGMVNRNCTTPDTKALFDHGIRMVYMYYDSNKTYVMEVVIDPSDCANINPQSDPQSGKPNLGT